MSEIEWPRLLCPHCGNHESFEFEIASRIGIRYGNKVETLIPTSGYSPSLPFNSRVWCLKCGKRGRWNSWQRNAYTKPTFLRGTLGIAQLGPEMTERGSVERVFWWPEAEESGAWMVELSTGTSVRADRFTPDDPIAIACHAGCEEGLEDACPNCREGYKKHVRDRSKPMRRFCAVIDCPLPAEFTAPGTDIGYCHRHIHQKVTVDGIHPDTPLDPNNLPYIPLRDNPTCYACFLEAEAHRTGWTKMVSVKHGYDRDGDRCQCQRIWEESVKEAGLDEDARMRGLGENIFCAIVDDANFAQGREDPERAQKIADEVAEGMRSRSPAVGEAPDLRGESNADSESVKE